mgnify:CR=1 FL=1
MNRISTTLFFFFFFFSVCLSVCLFVCLFLAQRFNGVQQSSARVDPLRCKRCSELFGPRRWYEIHGP